MQEEIMKLRIRAANGGATFRVEVPADCSLRTLRETIGQSLASNALPLSNPIRVSLNKTDEMQGSDSTLLSHFGVRSGDLLYYFDGQSLENFMNSWVSSKRCDDQVNFCGSARLSVDPAGTAESMDIVPQESRGAVGLCDRDKPNVRRELCAAAATKRASLAGHSSTNSMTTLHPSSVEDVRASVGAISNDTSSAAASDIDAKDSSQDSYTVVGSHVEASSIWASDSIPIILQRVLVAESKYISGPDVVLIFAVHAAMLETGFITWNASVGGSDVWLRQGTFDLHYTLPDIVQGVGASDAGHVILKCYTVGKFVVIYGTTNFGTPPPNYRLNLQISKYLVDKEEKTSTDPAVAKSDTVSSFSDLFGLWKCVKDDLSLPLLTALCERAGLPLPLSLLRLPIELKMKILECLPALDLARLGCTCSELRHLSANNELWKKLFLKEFGSASGQTAPFFGGWKETFQQRFLERKRALERASHPRKPRFYGISSSFRPYRGFPRIIGGDYDIFPHSGSAPFRGGLGDPRDPLGGLHRRL